MQLLYRIYFKIERIINEERARRLKASLKYCGKNVSIDNTCLIVVPKKLELGDNTSIAAHTVIYSSFGVKMGKNCLISSNCGISSVNHTPNSLNRYESGDEAENILYSKPVVLGDNVWVGMNACILPGITIGDNSIIGSGSVVTKNVPANEIWVGIPARFVKKLDL